jgi:hypothetical protein
MIACVLLTRLEVHKQQPIEFRSRCHYRAGHAITNACDWQSVGLGHCHGWPRIQMFSRKPKRGIHWPRVAVRI